MPPGARARSLACVPHDGKRVSPSFLRRSRSSSWRLGPYIKDIRKFLGVLVILDPLGDDLYKAKSTQPPLLSLLLGHPPLPSPLVRTSFMNGPIRRRR